MKVSEYATEVINKRPYKYSTRLNYIKYLKAIGIWNIDITEINSAIIFDRVDQISNQNRRKNMFIVCRSVFKELGKCQDLPRLDAISKVYELPEQAAIHQVIEKSKYRLQLLLCMYAGLRVGEACAVTPASLEGNYLNVSMAYSQDGKHFGSAKTVGKVLIPGWLADEVRAMRQDQYWKVGMPSHLVTWSCSSLSRRAINKEILGGKSINPHMLRHWFATNMIYRGVNPEIVRRQMRHKRVETTLKVYTQVITKDLEASLPSLPEILIIPSVKLLSHTAGGGSEK